MKKIVILDTAISSINIGDEIINASIRKNWPELFEKNYIFKMASHSSMYKAYQIFFFKKYFRVIREADYKFLCGTNALYTNMLRPKPNWNIGFGNVSLTKGTVCIGAGMGKNSKTVNWYTRKLYDKALSHEYIHSVRDENTKVFLEKMGFKAVNTGCPTLWGLTPDKMKAISHKKKDEVIFTLTYYEADRKRDLEMIDVLRKNYKKIHFWPQCMKDLDYLESITDVSDIDIIPANFESYDRILCTDIDYVGNRLHGGIFALQHQCRAIIIAIDHRVRDMGSNYSIPYIERTDIQGKLDSMINSEWETKITGLDFDKIQEWKNQFEI